MTKNKIFPVIFLILVLCAVSSGAQQLFRYKATLDPVATEGFYRIYLAADVLGKCNSDLSDIRIFDDKKQQLPYVINTAAKKVTDTNINLGILSASLDTAGNSIIILENKPGMLLQNMGLDIKANSVNRNIKLSGSNDQATWYIVADDMALQPGSTTTKGIIHFSLSIPPSNYQYFKLTILNNREDPLNVLNVKTHLRQEDIQAADYEEQVYHSFTQVDSAGFSYITLSLPEAIPAEKLRLDIVAPKFFQRNVRLLISEDTGKTFTEIAVGSLNPVNSRAIWFGLVKGSYYKIIVANEDNPALRLSAISLGYKPRSIIAWLEKGKPYTLQFGNPQAQVPMYDLDAFKDTIPDNMQTLPHQKPESIPQAAATNPKAKTPVYWVWISLTLALAVMGYFTFKLLKDMKKEDI